MYSLFQRYFHIRNLRRSQSNSLAPYLSQYNTAIRAPTPPLAHNKNLTKILDLTQDQLRWLSARVSSA